MKNINKIIKITLGVLVLLLLLYLSKDWWVNKAIEKLGGYTKKDIEITIDTVSVKYDTLFPKYKELTIKVKDLQERTPINNYYTTVVKKYIDENGKEVEVIEPVNYPLVYRHLNPVSDSLIDGNIETIINPTNSEIIDQKLSYTPKFPKFITKTITVEKKITETLTQEPKSKIGIGVTGINDLSVGIIGVYQTKNNWQFQGGYNKNFDITNPNENTLQFSIIKLF